MHQRNTTDFLQRLNPHPGIVGTKWAATKAEQSDDHNTKRAVCVFDSFHGWRRQWTCFLAGVQRFKIDQPLITCKGKTFQERDSIYPYLAPSPAHESAH